MSWSQRQLVLLGALTKRVKAVSITARGLQTTSTVNAQGLYVQNIDIMPNKRCIGLFSVKLWFDYVA